MPYAAYPPLPTNARYAARAAARYVYNNPHLARKAARTIRRAWNRSKVIRRKRSQRGHPQLTRVGETPGTQSAKRHIAVETDATDFNSRTYYAFNLTDIPQNTTNNDISARDRQVCYVSGFHICMEVRNQFSGIPCYLNVALVVPKASTTVNANDFFRGSGTDRSVNFDTSLSSIEFHCLPLNTDKFLVLKHNRYKLAPPTSAGVETGMLSQFLNVDFYVPFKRQLRWRDNNSALADNGNAYVLFWCDGFLLPGGTAAATAAIKVSKRFITYFRETK